LTKNYLINGSSDKGLNPFDRGLAYGDGVFRTFLVKNGRPLLWMQHFSKLSHDLNTINISLLKENILLKDISLLFPSSGSFVGKIIITRGISKRGYSYPENIKPTRILLKSKYTRIPKILYETGVTLEVCNTRVNNDHDINGIKHLSRFDNVKAKLELSSFAFDGIMLDQEGLINECITSSIFCRYGDVLTTSNHSRGGVYGVTKTIVVSKVKQLGLKMKYSNLSLEDLKKADEIVITNSLFGALQVTKINNSSWKNFDLSKKINRLFNEES